MKVPETFETTVSIDTLRDKTILLTGASGFVGKVVLEKLLRCVGGNGRIFLLMRGNRRFPSAEDRLYHEVLQSSLFDKLKSEQGAEFLENCLKKLHCLEGHLTQPLFGLDHETFAATAFSLDLIINAAASVDFREPLDDALKTNTLALDSLIDFSKFTPHCPLIHVSTCYVHGHHAGFCQEGNVVAFSGDLPLLDTGYVDTDAVVSSLQSRINVLYATISDIDERQAALVDLGLEVANAYGWNDTYTFTKWLGEQRLLNALQGRALTVLRPSIIESVLKDPTPGWIEGLKVADAVIMAYAREHVMLFPGRPSASIDIIPVDYVANSILISAAEALNAPCQHRFYQCGSSAENPVTLKTLIKLVRKASTTPGSGLDRLFPRQPKKSFVMVPAPLFKLITDGGLNYERWNYRLRKTLGLSSSKRALMKMETTVRLAVVFAFYTTQRYTFDNSELLALADRLSPADRAAFPVSTADIDWAHYLGNIHLSGLNNFALKPRPKKPEEPKLLRRVDKAH
tara:strand:- start:111430 stop:112968 length:1539 start_codon:yes stop_codon:yes gene_type:complete